MKFTDVQGGLHQAIALDTAGSVWTWGVFLTSPSGHDPGSGSTDASTPYKITQDANGNAFNHVIKVHASQVVDAAIKDDGTLWIWGDASGGLLADGTDADWVAYPTQVNLPVATGVKIIQISIGYATAVALGSDGSVWTWGSGGSAASPPTNTYQAQRDLGISNTSADYKVAHQVAFPTSAGKIVDIVSGCSYFHLALDINGQLYGWGYHAELLGLGTGGYGVTKTQLTPVALNTQLGFTQAVAKISASYASVHAILADGTLWGWGDAAQGEVGNGQELDYANNPYASNSGSSGGAYRWDWGVGEKLVMQPVQLMSSVGCFTDVFSGSAMIFYSYALDCNGNLYSWGRNKTNNLGNGVYPQLPGGAYSGGITANLPNSWDVPLITLINPFALTAAIPTNSPYCVAHPTDSQCH